MNKQRLIETINNFTLTEAKDKLVRDMINEQQERERKADSTFSKLFIGFVIGILLTALYRGV